MRILGLDLGSKRIGMALSDELLLTAGPFGVLRRKNMESDLLELGRVVEEQDVGEIVVGLPLHMHGDAGIQAKKAEDFAEVLRDRFGLPVHMWDERLSTVAVERVLIDADVSRKKRKKVIDSMAAAYFLQSFLDLRASEAK